MAAIGFVMFAGGFATYRFYSNRNADAKYVGASCKGTLPDGQPILVTLSGVSYRDPDGFESIEWRYQSIAIKTGARRAVRVVDGRSTCAPAGPGRLWIAGRGSLGLMSLPDLEWLYEPEALLQEVPELSAGLRSTPSPSFDPVSGIAKVHTSDGRQYVINPKDMTAKAPDGEPKTNRILVGSSRKRRARDANIEGQTYAFYRYSSERQKLYVMGRTEPSGPAVDAKDYLRPELLSLATEPGRKAIVVQDRLFFVHQSSLDEYKAKRTISSWSKTGAPWSVEGSWAKLYETYLEDGALIIIWGKPRAEAVSVDALTGQIRWSRHL